MLLVLLPLALITGPCCIVQRSVAMPLTILKGALIPASCTSSVQLHVLAVAAITCSKILLQMA